MKNIIILDEISDHKATFLIGLLVGMGLFYKIAPKSPMYRLLRERKRERYHTAKESRRKGVPVFEKDGLRVFVTAGNPEDIKVNAI